MSGLVKLNNRTMTASEFLTPGKIYKLQSEIDDNNGIIDDELIIKLLEDYHDMMITRLTELVKNELNISVVAGQSETPAISKYGVITRCLPGQNDPCDLCKYKKYDVTSPSCINCIDDIGYNQYYH